MGLPHRLIGSLAIGLLLVGAARAQPPIPDGLGAGETFHLVFATSEDRHGVTPLTLIPPPNFPDFGGLDAADWIVTNAAASAGLPLGEPGTQWNGLDLIYTAVLSNSTTNAIDRLGIQGPLFNTAGQRLATGEADFFDGALENAVGFDEFGEAVTGVVWTGSTSVPRRCSLTVLRGPRW